MGNEDAARSAYEAFSSGDLETLKEGFAEDAVWQTSDELPLGGVTKAATRSWPTSPRSRTTGRASASSRRTSSRPATS